MLYPKITRVAKSLPEKIVKNDDLASFIETSDEWIYKRTGIKERRIATNETTSSLSSLVAKQLVAGRDVLDIDLIIVGTMTPGVATPSVACFVQEAIGAKNALCFDVNAACSGFLYALSTAEKFLSSGKYKTAIVIGADVMSDLIDWSDRTTAVLFGDGAAGVLIETVSQTPCFIDELIQADGTRSKALHGRTMARSSVFKEVQEEQPYLAMDGKQIFDFALRDVSKNMTTLLESSQTDKNELNVVLAHQANSRILQALSKKTQIPHEKFLSNVANYGNTSAASIPLLLVDSVENGELSLDGEQLALITGYGAGLTWGSLLIKL